MANTFIQFRVEENIKIESTLICEQLGIDLATYLRMCMVKLIQNNGIPFELVVKENPAIMAMKRASLSAEQNGVNNMTLDEINEEIKKAREK